MATPDLPSGKAPALCKGLCDEGLLHFLHLSRTLRREVIISSQMKEPVHEVADHFLLKGCPKQQRGLTVKSFKGMFKGFFKGSKGCLSF